MTFLRIGFLLNFWKQFLLTLMKKENYLVYWATLPHYKSFRPVCLVHWKEHHILRKTALRLERYVTEGLAKSFVEIKQG